MFVELLLSQRGSHDELSLWQQKPQNLGVQIHYLFSQYPLLATIASVLISGPASFPNLVVACYRPEVDHAHWQQMSFGNFSEGPVALILHYLQLMQINSLLHAEDVLLFEQLLPPQAFFVLLGNKLFLYILSTQQ